MFLLMLLLFFLILILIFMLLLNFFMSNLYMNNKREKLSSFECGFDLLNISRLPFSIHFYLISILFLVFDVEIVLLFPMINSMNLLNYMNWLIVSMILMMILYFGLEYELKYGMLKWIF